MEFFFQKFTKFWFLVERRVIKNIRKSQRVNEKNQGKRVGNAKKEENI